MPNRPQQYRPAFCTNRANGRTEDRLDATQRGYDHRWRVRRKAHLNEHPLCVMCEAEGRVTGATIADHITPHRGDPVLFAGPLQSLCERCHNRKTAAGG